MVLLYSAARLAPERRFNLFFGYRFIFFGDVLEIAIPNITFPPEDASQQPAPLFNCGRNRRLAVQGAAAILPLGHVIGGFHRCS